MNYPYLIDFQKKFQTFSHNPPLRALTKDSDINIEGSDISGKQGSTLIADNQVNIKAIEENHQERSTNKSSGFNAEVAIKVSNGAVAGATLGGNSGKGYGKTFTCFFKIHKADFFRYMNLISRIT